MGVTAPGRDGPERMGYDTGDAARTPARAVAAEEIGSRWPLVLLVALASVVAAMIASSVRDGPYTAKLRLLITPIAQQDERFLGTSLIRDSGDAARTAATVAESLTSRKVEAETARRLGGDWSATSVRDAVDVTPVIDANLVEIAAQAVDPKLASRLATTFAAATLNVRWGVIAAEIADRVAVLDDLRETTADDGGLGRDRDILAAALRGGKDPTLRLQDGAPTVSADAPSTPVVTVLALVGGLFLGGLAAVAIGLVRRRLRDEDEVLAVYPLPVLARVHRDMLLVMRLADTLPVLPRQEAFGALADRMVSSNPDGATIAVASPSAGDDRALTAASIAAALEERDRSAAVIEPPASGAGREDMAGLIASARERADFVVVDGPLLTGGAQAIAAAGLADVVVLVVRLGHTDRRDLSRGREVLERSGVAPAGLVLVYEHGTRREVPRSGGEAAGGPSGVQPDLLAIDR
jgi:capsular polysaccharide biosynthesis protein